MVYHFGGEVAPSETAVPALVLMPEMVRPGYSPIIT